VFQDGVGDYYSGKYDVLNDGPIKRVEDLKGKVIAASAAGSAMDIGLRAMLRQHHLDDRKDVSIIEAQFPSMPAMLAEKKADLITATVPFSEDPKLNAIAHPLFTQKDAVGPTQMIVWVAHQSFLVSHRAATVDFLADALNVLHYFQDPKNHQEVAGMLASYMKQQPEQMGWMFTKGDFYRDPNGKPNLKVMQTNIDQLHDLGIVPATFDVATYADLGPISDAAAQLAK
jgi:sulfonate transport system substrate-binding protein